MVYTCYEMIRDCRADLPSGWRYFLTHYVPAIRRLIAQYAPDRADDEALLQRILIAIRNPKSSIFQSMEPAPERWFVAGLRQEVLAHLDAPRPEIELELQTVADALAPLTVTEKQAAWLESMHYSAEQVAPMLRVSAATVGKIHERAAELIRGKVDAWRRTLLEDNSIALGRAALAAAGGDCLPGKTFLDIIEGRTTWSGREQTERHVTGCWHCIDHFCRMLEVVEVMRGAKPLPEAETVRYRRALNLPEEKTPAWKRLFGGA
jgi:hypothetical protein